MPKNMFCFFCFSIDKRNSKIFLNLDDLQKWREERMEGMSISRTEMSDRGNKIVTVKTN